MTRNLLAWAHLAITCGALGGCAKPAPAPPSPPAATAQSSRDAEPPRAATESSPSEAANPATTPPDTTKDQAPADAPQNKPPAGEAAAKNDSVQWTSLFDGKSLGNWLSTQFGGEGEVQVADGQIVLEMGNDLTGVTWKGEPPGRMDYEIELEAMRLEGSDFFCGLTFPVGPDSCSLICGGWGGGVTGLSSLNGLDASDNETSQWINYQSKRWYRIRVRVTMSKIEAWLDDKQIVNATTTGRRISIRPEVDPSRPLGIATWRTTGAIQSIRWRAL